MKPLALVQESAVDLARQVQDRRRGDEGLELAAHGVRRPGTRGGDEHPEPPRSAGVTVRRPSGTLLVANRDGSNPAVVA